LPELVSRAVLQVIRGEPEVLVTPGPVRPLLAIKALIPRLEGRMLRAMGITKVMAARAAAAK
jgi:hypothetical protein